MIPTIKQHFTSVHDLPSLSAAIALARQMKAEPFAQNALGNQKTMLLVFFNSSLRTRLSTQRAAMNLGMNTIVIDMAQGAWRLETERGVVMDGDKAEHILEAIPVMGCYADIIGVRSFAALQNREYDYAETILQQFIDYAGKPIVSMEAATRHPLQSFADVLTIEENKRTTRPRVVLTWAPHPKALPQAVANSFAEWCNAMDYDLVVTHPYGYELAPQFVRSGQVEYNQRRAFDGADFIYAKNWSAYDSDNYGSVLSKDREWMVDVDKMRLTNSAYFMHCLPVRRNMIVSDEVIEGRQSLVIPQAANRMPAAQAVLAMILSKNSL